ncbi:MAG: C1 family peptidase [Candidatus Sericytochromatia bacterium]
MKSFRHLTLGALTLVTLATAVGCGQTGPINAPGMTGMRSAQPAVSVSGVKRTLGYDWARFQKKYAGKIKPRKMRQGLRASKMDLRQHDAPVYDQGELGACTAFAMGKGMREHMARKNGERVVPLSALFMYYETRKVLGSIDEDSGGTITDGMAVMKKVGVAEEQTWAYDIAKFKIKPPSAAYSEAKEFKVKETIPLGSLNDVKQMLAEGNPVAFGYIVYDSFTKIGASGKMPMPKAGEKTLGGHAVVAVGYDDQKKHLIVRNSWGSKWADDGYFYMPYEFVTPDNTADFWAAK